MVDVRRMFRSTAAGAVLWAFAAAADVVHFVNGDRLTGTLTKAPPEAVAIDVPHVGVVVVPSAQVARTVPAQQAAPRAKQTVQADPTGDDSGKGFSAWKEWDIRLNLGLAAASGNIRTQDLNLAAAAGRTGDVFDNMFKLAARRANARAEGPVIRTKDQLDLAYDLRWKYSDSWYAATNFQFFRDPIKDIDQRYTVGAGFGHTLWDEKHGTLKTDIGISQIFETRAGAARAMRSDDPALRWSLTFKHWLKPDLLEIFHHNELLRVLAHEQGIVWDSDTGMRFHLNSRWHAGLRLDVQHETDPAVGRAGTDASYAIDLGMKM